MTHPDIFIYNPTTELALANQSPYYLPPDLLRTFETDLETIPALYARQDDIVIVSKLPDKKTLERLYSLTQNNIRFHTIHELGQTGFGTFNEIKPWGWNQVIHHRFKAFSDRCSPAFKASPNYQWTPEHRFFLSRMTSIKVTSDLWPHLASSQHLRIEEIPQLIHSDDELQALLQKLKYRAVIKTLWSSSGRGVRFALPHLDQRWVGGMLRNQGGLSVEPYLNKIADISFHFMAGESGINYLGHTFFKTDKKGNYKGNYIDPFPKEIQTIIPDDILIPSIREASAQLLKVITRQPFEKYYQGPVGIDGLFYKDSNGSIYLHPCIETNCRYTMGYLALRLRERIPEGGMGYVYIDNPGNKNPQDTQPTHIKGGKITQGTFQLNPNSRQFGLFITVTPL